MEPNNRERNKNNDKESRSYEKELTIEVEIQGEDRVTMMELLKKVKEECGNVIACRFKTPKKYELTMLDASGKDKLMDGLKIGNNIVVANELTRSELVVSFIALPAYITDEEILTKLRIWGVTPVSPIKRRVWPGTDIVEGTRFVKVRFPKEVLSLPYSTKFETLQGVEHFRVIHDKQIRVCRLCVQPGHIMRDCPEFLCFKCQQQGHYARECVNSRAESEEFYSDPEEGEGDHAAITSDGEQVVEAESVELEEVPPAGREEEPPAELEVVEETPAPEGEESESGAGKQRESQRDGVEPHVSCGAAATQAATIGGSMDAVLEELDLSVGGKIERDAGGVGSLTGPAPPPNDHVSTPTGLHRLPQALPFDQLSVRNGRGRALKKVTTGVSAPSAPGAGGEMRQKELTQESWKVPDTALFGEDMDSSPDAANTLKRKAREARRANEKSLKK